MTTPEVTALSEQDCRELAVDIEAPGWTCGPDTIRRLLATISERDERVLVLEQQIVQHEENWVALANLNEGLRAELASLKSREVSGDDRAELICLACCGFKECPLTEVAAQKGIKLDCKEGFLDCRADAIIAAGFRGPLESSQTQADDDGELSQGHRLDGNPDASPAQQLTGGTMYHDQGFAGTRPAEPVKVAGREAALAKWFFDQWTLYGIIDHSNKSHCNDLALALLASGILTGRKLDAGKIEGFVISILGTGNVTVFHAARRIATAICADSADIWTDSQL